MMSDDEKYDFTRGLADQEEEGKRHRHKGQPRHSRRMYYWIVTRHQGRQVLIFGGNDEAEANRHGLEKVDAHFDIIELPTRDVAAASRMLKGRRLEDGAGLGGSLDWLRHKIKRKGEGEGEC